MTPFRAIEAQSLAGGEVNEDAFGATFDVLVAVDGATGLSGRHQIGVGSDAQWFANNLAQDILMLAADRHRSLPQVLDAALDRCRARLRRMQVPLEGFASASVAVARLGAEHLEFVSVGDCTALLTMVDGRVERIADGAVAKLDDRVVRAAVDLAARERISVREAIGKQSALLKRHRALRNRQGGYWIAEPNGTAVDHATARRFPISEVSEVALLTDGFAAVHDLTRQVEGWRELAELLAAGAGGRLMRELRTALQRDTDFSAFPRLKEVDDSTFVRGNVQALLH